MQARYRSLNCLQTVSGVNILNEKFWDLCNDASERRILFPFFWAIERQKPFGQRYVLTDSIFPSDLDVISLYLGLKLVKLNYATNYASVIQNPCRTKLCQEYANGGWWMMLDASTQNSKILAIYPRFFKVGPLLPAGIFIFSHVFIIYCEGRRKL